MLLLFYFILHTIVIVFTALDLPTREIKIHLPFVRLRYLLICVNVSHLLDIHTLVKCLIQKMFIEFLIILL